MGGAVMVGVLFVPFAIAICLMDYLFFPVLSAIFLGSFQIFPDDSAGSMEWFIYIMGFIPLYVSLVYCMLKVNGSI